MICIWSLSPLLWKVGLLGLSNEALEIIERGAPQELVGTFRRMFDAKIQETQKDAQIAGKKMNWPEGPEGS